MENINTCLYYGLWLKTEMMISILKSSAYIFEAQTSILIPHTSDLIPQLIYNKRSLLSAHLSFLPQCHSCLDSEP